MSRKSRKNVGVIGLGIVGTRVAAGLRAGGYQVYVWNRSAKPAPNFLGSPAEIADAADIIQIFVADAAALFEVIEAMGDSLTARHIIVCCATVGPEAVMEAAQIVEAKGAQFLDAPFTGSKLAAEKRQLVYYIGGAEHTFLKAKPVLEVTSKAIVRIGEVGHAASVKVVTNMISAVTVQVLAEALSIVQKAGLEPEVLAAAIEHNACRSGVIDLKLPKMIAGDFDPHFSLKHMFKDVQLGIHMANALDIEVPATTVTAGVMYGALNQGWGDLDFSALFKNYTADENADELPALPGVSIPANHLQEEEIAERELAALVAPEKPEEPKVETPPEPVAAQPDPATALESSTAGANGAVITIGEPAVPATVARVPVVEFPSDVLSPSPEVPRGPASENPAPASTGPADPFAEPKAATPDGESPAPGAEETVVRPNNFVRRWFVARSGG